MQKHTARADGKATSLCRQQPCVLEQHLALRPRFSTPALQHHTVCWVAFVGRHSVGSRTGPSRRMRHALTLQRCARASGSLRRACDKIVQAQARRSVLQSDQEQPQMRQVTGTSTVVARPARCAQRRTGLVSRCQHLCATLATPRSVKESRNRTRMDWRSARKVTRRGTISLLVLAVARNVTAPAVWIRWSASAVIRAGQTRFVVDRSPATWQRLQPPTLRRF